MSLRFACGALFVLTFCAIADDQQASPAKPNDSAPPAKADSQSSHPRVRLGGIMIGAGYTHFSGRYPYFGYYPGFWSYGPYYYDLFLFSPYIHPGFYNGFAYQPYMGDVKIQAANKAASVFLDGALAGRADKLRDMWLEPGSYNLEIRDGVATFSRRIYVLSGKTLKVTPETMVKEVRQ
jgi:hypothetical protein